ncbi:hypothetical protein PHSC3_000992 [Chlamydiales bacterium STE3]|nr:hypothetical protein PHSC3_000992 [Chlamydiales bacterium STE3]
MRLVEKIPAHVQKLFVNDQESHLRFHLVIECDQNRKEEAQVKSLPLSKIFCIILLRYDLALYGYIESFNGKLRDECLNENWFLNLKDARSIIEKWREDYNCYRPHTSSKGLSPGQFANSIKMENINQLIA